LEGLRINTKFNGKSKIQAGEGGRWGLRINTKFNGKSKIVPSKPEGR